jgi:hypothetical protein
VCSDVSSDAPGLITGQQLGGRTATRLVLAIERLPVAVADDEAGVGLFNSARLWKAAVRSGHGKV